MVGTFLREMRGLARARWLVVLVAVLCCGLFSAVKVAVQAIRRRQMTPFLAGAFGCVRSRLYPYASKKIDDEPQGFSIDVVRDIADASGLECSFVGVDSPRPERRVRGCLHHNRHAICSRAFRPILRQTELN